MDCSLKLTQQMSVLSITVKTADGSREGLSEWQLIVCPRYPLNVHVLLGDVEDDCVFSMAKCEKSD